MNKDLKNYTILQDSQKCVHLKYNKKWLPNFFFFQNQKPNRKHTCTYENIYRHKINHKKKPCIQLPGTFIH